MDGYKLASVAGMITMATSVFVEYSLPVVVSQAGGAPSQPTSPSQPSRPGSPTERPTDPFARPTPGAPGAQPGALNQPGTPVRSEPMFQLREPSLERNLTELGRELQRIEARMEDSNEALMRQLEQARQLDGDRKIDALTEVLQGVLREHATMRDYLSDMREAITGRISEGERVLPTIDPALPDIDDDVDDFDDDPKEKDPFSPLVPPPTTLPSTQPGATPPAPANPLPPPAPSPGAGK